MNERYKRIFFGDENLYSDGAPILVRASALLKDTATEQIIGQVKFKNLSGKNISYLKISIVMFDTLKKQIGEAFPFEYFDVSAADQKEFGSKIPIYFPNTSVRSFAISECSVMFDDGSTWNSDTSAWSPLDNASHLFVTLSTEETYKKAISLCRSNNLNNLKQALHFFDEIKEHKDVKTEIDACEKKIRKRTSTFYMSKAMFVFAIVLSAISLGWIMYLISVFLSIDTSDVAELVKEYENTPGLEYYALYLKAQLDSLKQILATYLGFALAQFAIVVSVVVLRFISGKTSIFPAKILLVSLLSANLLVSCSILIISLLHTYELLFYVINCVLSVLFFILCFLKSKRNEVQPRTEDFNDNI